MKRPRVFINMAISVDGKIAPTQRATVKLGSKNDSMRMAEVRAEVDAVLCGTGTFNAHPFPLVIHQKDLIEKRVQKGMDSQPASVVICSDIKSLKRNTPWQKKINLERWVFCGNGTSPADEAYFTKDQVEVFRMPGRRPQPAAVLKALAERDCHTVLLEGGGTFNASFFEEDLVDRIYLTICPIIIGGAEAPTIADGAGFTTRFSRWRLVESLSKSGEIFCTYERKKNSWQSVDQGVSGTGDPHEFTL